MPVVLCLFETDRLRIDEVKEWSLGRKKAFSGSSSYSSIFLAGSSAHDAACSKAVFAWRVNLVCSSISPPHIVSSSLLSHLRHRFLSSPSTTTLLPIVSPISNIKVSCLEAAAAAHTALASASLIAVEAASTYASLQAVLFA